MTSTTLTYDDLRRADLTAAIESAREGIARREAERDVLLAEAVDPASATTLEEGHPLAIVRCNQAERLARLERDITIQEFQLRDFERQLAEVAP